MKHMNYLRMLPICCFMSWGLQAAAQSNANSSEMNILPFAGPNMNDVVVDSTMTVTRSDNDTGTIDIYVSCFGTNLRSVANPVSPNATITAYIDYVNKDGATRTASVDFSAQAAMVGKSMNQTLSSAKVETAAGGATTEMVDAYLRDTLIRLRIKNTKTVGVDVLASGTDFGKLQDVNARTVLFKSIRFQQTMPAGTPVQQFMGKNGPLSASLRWYWSENGKKATVYAGFPGENKFCGGYFSPLMLAFDNESLPNVDKSSTFTLDKRYGFTNGKIAWPSFSRELYFLGQDSNNNGIIDDGSELFGDINGYADGFENLAAYDLNKDGVIDAKDKIFEHLVLWKDSDHNGVCKKVEVKSLKAMGVVSINLHNKGSMRDLGKRASLMGPGEFSFVDKKGVSKKGWVWDIFLSRVP
jgi:hypothetical protein